MRINGAWQTCDDEAIRPVFRGEVQTAAGSWISTWFLVDTGADRTVLCADDLARLHVEQQEATQELGGVGGVVNSVEVSTSIRLRCDDGAKANFRGDYAGFTKPEALDMSVLGGTLRIYLR